MATRCDNPEMRDEGVHLPAPADLLPDCLAKMTVIDMTDIAKKTCEGPHLYGVRAAGAFNLLEQADQVH